MDKLKGTLSHRLAAFRDHLGPASIVLVVILGAGAALLWPGAPLASWLWGSEQDNTLILSGNIEAHESVLSFKTIQSRITELPFDEGATVKAGTVLARTENADYRQQVAIDFAALEVQQRQLAVDEQNVDSARQTVISDRADLAEKKLDLGRDEALLKKQAISTQARDLQLTAEKQSAATLNRDRALERAAERNVELAIASVQNAKDTLKLAKIVLGYTVLTAPFTGVILVRQAELGESVVPGSPVVTLADIDHVWLRAYVNETDISRIRFGEPVTVTTDSYPGKHYRGRISFIAAEAEFTPKSVETHAERVTLVYRIRIDIANPTHELVPGLPGDAHIALLPAGAP
ncbi:MAG: efflux RND transporter periplasmic adaptor subunit [Rhizomicrobium sp.]